MLTDPLVVKGLSLAAASAITVLNTNNFARVDAGDGSARYICSGPGIGPAAPSRAELKISHSVSNENKPAKTDRTLVRLDVDTVDPEGRAMVAYAYIVVGVPRGAQDVVVEGTLITGADLLQSLLGVCCVSSTAATLELTKLSRIVAGES